MARHLLALEKLGMGPCHHMSAVFAEPRLPPLWARAFEGTLSDFEEIFKDYRATTVVRVDASDDSGRAQSRRSRRVE